MTLRVLLALLALACGTAAPRKFAAAAANPPDLTVRWSADVGTIDQTGLYTAPATPGSAHVTATANAGSPP